MAKKFRNSGAVGALLDELEKAVDELISVIKPLSDREIKKIIDKETNDPHCVSIQSILSHVVRSGYNYIVVIRKNFGENLEYQELETRETAQQYQVDLTKMFEYNVQFFRDYPDVDLEEYDDDKKIKVRWGQRYDIEQLMEHAIVHVLRHRRQIERFILKLARS